MRKKSRKNCIKITLEVKEVLQTGAEVTYQRLSDYNEIVVNDKNSIHNSINKLTAYTKQYMEDNGVGE